MDWKVLEKRKSSGLDIEETSEILLKNRGITSVKQRKEFFDPTPPDLISVKSLSLGKSEIDKAIERIKTAKDNSKKVLVYGDYDADGICATAILWEALNAMGLSVLPYIPDRFSEGYGINPASIKKLKIQDSELSLIITVDNGIVANETVDIANELGIDVIVTDHHTMGKAVPKAHSIIHTTDIGGAALAWIFARELLTKLPATSYKLQSSLELAGIGTISDQLPLVGPNRSFAKYGLAALNNTKRPGLSSMFAEAAISANKLGTYEVNFVIAPRLNAMGRMEHAIDSLRLLCTTSSTRASELASTLGRTNKKRQKTLENVIAHAETTAEKKKWDSVIVLSGEAYHEGVIGLAASKLVEKYYLPAIVISKGEKISKASARSIPGFDIISAIRKLDKLIIGGGGHPMAAGFSIETRNIKKFVVGMEKIGKKLLTKKLRTKQLSVDLEIDFELINDKLNSEIARFEPFGIGNPRPSFLTRKVSIINVRSVGADAKHLKLELAQGGFSFNAIAFNKGDFYPKIVADTRINIVHSLNENTWNGRTSLELQVKDLELVK